MSIYSAMQSGVSGLFANAEKVSKISDNIANSNTVGYKRSFADFVTSRASSSINSSNMSAPAGVKSVVKTNISTQGNILTTGVATDISITGEGFFTVARNPNETDSSGFSLTRAGSFRPDEDGNLVNSAGKYLHGFKYDNQGNLGVLDRTSFNTLKAVNIKEVEMIGDGTTFMTFNGNLPAQETGSATTGVPFQSSAEYFSPLGTSERLIFDWTPTTTDNTWTASVSDSAGNNFGTADVTFHDSGANAGSPQTWFNITNNATAPNAFALDPTTGQATVTIDNGAAPQEINVNLGSPGDFTGITQFSGDYTTQQIDKNGAAAGKLASVEISDDGTVYGLFNNGAKRALYQVPLATLTNPNGLTPRDGNTFGVTKDAGSFRLVDSNSGFAGKINNGTLERSNVDIAEELTSLIETQRAYSSNAKIITTSDEMLEETTRIKR